jgi:phospholipid/cholesterol/gamma-HCH transport system substrate-binding protein
MKSTNNKRAVIIGIFIFLGIAILIVTILTLGSQHKTFEKSITIEAVFDDVNGLQKGNNIWFSGVKIGIVKKISISGNAKVKVSMDIEDRSHQFIRKDAKAKISTDGLIGNKIVVIYGGSLQVPEVETGDVLGIEKLLSTDEMMSTLAKNNDNFLAITNGLKVISKRLVDGQGTIGKLMTDETLVNDLDATAITLKSVSLNLEKLSSNVAAYTSRLSAKGSLTNDLVTDTVVFNKLRSTVLQLQQIAETSKGVVDNLKVSTNTFNDALNNKNAPVGMLLHDEQAAATIKTTLQNLQSGTKKMDEDLEALQHNFLLRGFFRKKARNEKADSTKNN